MTKCHSFLCERQELNECCFGWRGTACAFPPEASSVSFFSPSSCLWAGIGLTTCWLQLQTQRITVFLSEMTEKGEREVKLLAWFCLSLSFQASSDPPLFPDPPLILKSTVSSCWPPGPMGLHASCLTSHINLPSFLQISTDQISYFQSSGYKAPFSGIISN